MPCCDVSVKKGRTLHYRYIARSIKINAYIFLDTPIAAPHPRTLEDEKLYLGRSLGVVFDLLILFLVLPHCVIIFFFDTLTFQYLFGWMNGKIAKEIWIMILLTYFCNIYMSWALPLPAERRRARGPSNNSCVVRSVLERKKYFSLEKYVLCFDYLLLVQSPEK